MGSPLGGAGFLLAAERGSCSSRRSPACSSSWRSSWRPPFFLVDDDAIAEHKQTYEAACADTNLDVEND